MSACWETRQRDWLANDRIMEHWFASYIGKLQVTVTRFFGYSIIM